MRKQKQLLPGEELPISLRKNSSPFFLSFFVCQQDFGFGRVSTHAASPAPSTRGLKGSSQNYNASTVLAIGHTSPNTTHETPSHASTTKDPTPGSTRGHSGHRPKPCLGPRLRRQTAHSANHTPARPDAPGQHPLVLCAQHRGRLLLPRARAERPHKPGAS